MRTREYRKPPLLPLEIVFYLAAFCHFRDLARFMRTSRQMKQVISSVTTNYEIKEFCGGKISKRYKAKFFEVNHIQQKRHAINRRLNEIAADDFSSLVDSVLDLSMLIIFIGMIIYILRGIYLVNTNEYLKAGGVVVFGFFSIGILCKYESYRNQKLQIEAKGLKATLRSIDNPLLHG